MFRTPLMCVCVCVCVCVWTGVQVYRQYVYAKCVYVCVFMHMYAVCVLSLFVRTRYLISAWLQAPPPPPHFLFLGTDLRQWAYACTWGYLNRNSISLGVLFAVTSRRAPTLQYIKIYLYICICLLPILDTPPPPPSRETDGIFHGLFHMKCTLFLKGIFTVLFHLHHGHRVNDTTAYVLH